MANMNITKRVIREAFVELLNERALSKITVKIVQDYPTLNSLDGCIQAAMKFVMENKRAIAHLYYSDNRSTYVSALWRICEQAVRTYVDTVFPEDELSGRDREIIIRYHKCECFGLIIDWISNGMREDILEDMHRLLLLRKGSTEELIRRSKQIP